MGFSVDNICPKETHCRPTHKPSRCW